MTTGRCRMPWWHPDRCCRTVSLALVVLLAACSSSPRRGFYQDDGPPDRPPADLARAPDAVPRVETFHPFANRPYSVLGRSYTPMTDDRAFRQRGLASWYGKQFHGNRTSNGERYDMFAMTAAHTTLPLPSYVRVTHLKTGQSVILRVNDRGPFKSDRVIDLSYAAAVKLGIAAAGTGEVEVVRLTHADIRTGRYRTDKDFPEEQRVAAAQPVALLDVAAASSVLPSAAPVVSPDLRSMPDSALPPDARRWAVQVGAFSQEAYAIAWRDRVAALLTRAPAQAGDGLSEAEDRLPRVERDGSLYRVLIGLMTERELAQALAAHLRDVLQMEVSLFAGPVRP
jgi:rare lipoprotein A